MLVGVVLVATLGGGHGFGQVAEVGRGCAVVGVPEPAGPGELARRGLLQGPPAVVAQPMIMTAIAPEIGVGGFSALGVFDAVVGVAAVRGHPAPRLHTGAIPHADPAAQCRAGQSGGGVAVGRAGVGVGLGRDLGDDPVPPGRMLVSGQCVEGGLVDLDPHLQSGMATAAEA